MDWTPENRLKLIKAIVQMRYQRATTYETLHDFLQRIMFLCDMPDAFLENNISNYQDAIDFSKIGKTTEL